MRTALLQIAFLCLAAASLRAQAPLHDLSAQPGDALGTALAPIGDLNGDGHGDLILGAAYADGVQPDAGRVVVVSGKTGATLLVLLGQHTGDRFGYSVASRPDVNSDGRDDIVVGVTGYDGAAGSNTGRVETHASDGSGLITFLEGPSAGDQFGWCVKRLGDCNNDGVDEFAMGAPYFDGIATDGGRVYVFSGIGLSTLDAESGLQAGWLFGYSLDFAGDLDGDLYGDLIVGVPGYKFVPNSKPGAVMLASTASGLGVSSFLTGSGTFSELGFSVAALEDFDGDGVRDLAAGEPGWSGNGANSGRVLICSGATKLIVREFQGSSWAARATSTTTDRTKPWLLRPSGTGAARTPAT
jgi:hypothetical protein